MGATISRAKFSVPASRQATCEVLRAVPELEASVGAARFSGTENLPAAIERADRAMYEEKARNRAARVGAGGVAARF